MMSASGTTRIPNWSRPDARHPWGARACSLMTNSNLLDFMTDRSAGFVLLKMRPSASRSALDPGSGVTCCGRSDYSCHVRRQSRICGQWY
jgi:hypothetical protein